MCEREHATRVDPMLPWSQRSLPRHVIEPISSHFCPRHLPSKLFHFRADHQSLHMGRGTTSGRYGKHAVRRDRTAEYLSRSGSRNYAAEYRSRKQRLATLRATIVKRPAASRVPNKHQCSPKMWIKRRRAYFGRVVLPCATAAPAPAAPTAPRGRGQARPRRALRQHLGI